MTRGTRESGWLVVEAVAATAVALALSLRLERSSVWVLVALGVVLARGRSFEDLAVEPRLTPPSFRTHLVVGAAALAIYAAAHAAVVILVGHARFRFRLPPDLGGIALHQLVGVAFPEELFFRGYLQTTLDRAFGRSGRVGRARVGAGIVLQAALFAACHVATGDWTRLRVFFFGLLAGWLRDRSGSIAAPIAYHAVGNVWYAIVSASFR
jgi:membrane protease YdiL (CAAX protease family)